MHKPVLAADSGVGCAETASWRQAVLELAEARLRQLVADRLGVPVAQVVANARLGEDLGADEVDLLEIAVGMEEEFGLVVSDAVLSGLRTYGDLWVSLALSFQSLTDADAAELLASGIARVRVIRNPPDEEGSTLRAARITPRLIEDIIEEVLWTKGVVRLEVICAPDTSDRRLARIAERLAWLRNRGVQISVQRSGSDIEPAIGTGRHASGDTASQSVAPPAQERTTPPPRSGGIGFANQRAVNPGSE